MSLRLEVILPWKNVASQLKVMPQPLDGKNFRMECGFHQNSPSMLVRDGVVHFIGSFQKTQPEGSCNLFTVRHEVQDEIITVWLRTREFSLNSLVE